ncbi:MAG: DUF3592 domain-containing protein [Alphaproteobacteria bacterium]
MSVPLAPAQEKSTRRGLRVIGAVFFCVGLYLAFNLYELKSGGIRTPGKVVDENIVVFATEGGQGVKFRSNGQRHVGDAVTVLYLREAPQSTAITERGLLIDGRMAWSQLLFGAIVLYLNREKGKSAADQKPDTLGFTAEEVQRETPVLNNDGTFDSFVTDSCMKYSLLRPGGPYGDWQLLQKFPKEGGLPNGFILVAKDPPPQLTRALVPLTEEYGDDYYEFERSGDTVSVYCWKASKSTLKKLSETLNALEA